MCEICWALYSVGSVWKVGEALSLSISSNALRPQSKVFNATDPRAMILAL